MFGAANVLNSLSQFRERREVRRRVPVRQLAGGGDGIALVLRATHLKAATPPGVGPRGVTNMLQVVRRGMQVANDDN